MFDVKKVELEWAGKNLIIETGKIARQADASVIVTYGGTTVMTNVVAAKKVKPDMDFFPLTVNYQEKAYASGKIPFIEFNESPIYFFLILLLIPAFRDAHFYLVHRFLHFKFMYKIAHSVHHRNINPGPWSSLSMHPIEHLLYFSGVIVHWLILSHPLHAIYHLFHAGLGSANGHIGFKQMLLNDKHAIDLSNYNHYLHHKYFEVNYGNLMIPFDQWFGTYHDGSKELHEKMKIG